jgi:hypothetical protein
MFLSALEDQLGLIVAPPLAPVARMSIIEKEIDKLTRAAELLRAPDNDDTTAACVHHWVASANPGVLCKCSLCGAETPLS